jgi:hypothetical protein
MEKPNNKDTEFHAVEFMRQVRDEMGAEFEKDPDTYLARLKELMQAFKEQQAAKGNKAA